MGFNQRDEKDHFDTLTHFSVDVCAKFEMNNQKIIFTEKCGTLGRRMLYTKDEEHNKVERLRSTDTFAKSVLHRLKDLFREIFLPHGYPDSVSEDYLEYQVWDTIQAFCSTITGTFTTQAILKSVGVGNASATPFAAALTWVMKDGTGMIGRIVFAWWKGNSLDSDCKKWRLCADIINDVAMFIELLIPYVQSFSLQMLCVTTAMKAVVGVAGGATRASITQHQAIQGNMADVSAKDGSQETCVNLIASFVGIVLLAVVTDHRYQWVIFGIFTMIHLLANYFAVCSLNIQHLNVPRLVLVLRTYLRYNTVPNPFQVNQKESVIIGFGQDVNSICGFKIVIGDPLKCIPTSCTLMELTGLLTVYENSKYFLIVDTHNKVIYVALEKGENSTDVITAYFHAVLLGVATCHYNKLPVNVYSKRQLHHVTSIMRLYTALKAYPKNESMEPEQLPLEELKSFNDFLNQEITMFFTALKVNGWDTNRHSIEVGEWRACWKTTDFKSQVLAEHSKSE